jgi:hypothetical protein
MKYPVVIFFRYEKYNFIDKLFTDEIKNLNCTVKITNDYKYLNNLFDSNYHVLVTFGNNCEEYYNDIYSIIADRMNYQWVHLKEIEDINNFNNSVNYCYVSYLLKDRKKTRPIFSIFTTCYNSYNKIIRAYESLKKQILKDWEWVILDDSPDNNHFVFLKEKFDNDKRIRLYKRNENSGNIGNVKNEAVSLCRGSYVLELDHDDEILPYVLSDSSKVFNENPEIGFIYMDFINIYEDSTNFWYGDYISKGYGGYYYQKYNNRWVYVFVTPKINNVTLSHLISLPNHPRIWRKDVLLNNNIENYSEYLPICDDLEVLLKTALNTKIAKIPKLGYIQYMNNNNNNFSLIRNSEINRLGPKYIVPIFYKNFEVNEKMKKINAYEDEIYINNFSKIWTRKNYEHKYCNKIIQYDYDCQYCILGLEAFYENIEKLKKLYSNSRNDFLLLEENMNIDTLTKVLDNYGFDNMKCYSMKNTSDEEFLKYFDLIYRSCDNYDILCIPTYLRKLNLHLEYNTDLENRHDVIMDLNKDVNKSYLEIGVEYGTTFNNVHFLNKVGVDPSPKIDDHRILLKTSDKFFEDNNKCNTFDVIFIDGMHQANFFLKDFINSMKVLNEGGVIIVDDILPLNYNEQLKIPVKHYYEDNILKYGEPWTGDGWSVVYFILKNYSNNFEFTYYNHPNYRGIGVFKNIKPFEINYDIIKIINTYQYFRDFKDYLKLFC